VAQFGRKATDVHVEQLNGQMVDFYTVRGKDPYVGRRLGGGVVSGGSSCKVEEKRSPPPSPKRHVEKEIQPTRPEVTPLNPDPDLNLNPNPDPNSNSNPNPNPSVTLMEVIRTLFECSA